MNMELRVSKVVRFTIIAGVIEAILKTVILAGIAVIIVEFAYRSIFGG